MKLAWIKSNSCKKTVVYLDLGIVPLDTSLEFLLGSLYTIHIPFALSNKIALARNRKEVWI